MITINKPLQRWTSHMRPLLQLVFRLRPIYGAEAFELDVAEQNIRAEIGALVVAAGEAKGLELDCARARRQLHAALTDAKTPGVVDRDEAADLCRTLLDTSAQAHTHTKHLEALT